LCLSFQRCNRRYRLRRVGSSSSFRLSSSYLHTPRPRFNPLSSVVGSRISAMADASTQEKASTRWDPFAPKRNETRCANIFWRGANRRSRISTMQVFRLWPRGDEQKAKQPGEMRLPNLAHTGEEKGRARKRQALRPASYSRAVKGDLR
jgi:hypothetical protein